MCSGIRYRVLLRRFAQSKTFLKQPFPVRATARFALLAYFGGGAADGGTGLPSIVFGSISSMRVPSGSNRFA
jgi:hypothetical protein